MTTAWSNPPEPGAHPPLPPTAGDPLPDAPEHPWSPEKKFAQRGFSRGLRRSWIALTHLRRALPMMPARDQVEQVTVVHPGRLRDLVFAEPALRALRLRFGSAKRDLYASEDAAALYAGSGWGEIKPLDRLGAERNPHPGNRVVLDLSLEAEYELAKRIQHVRFEHRVGVNLAGRGAFYNIPARPSMVNDHYADYYLQLAELIGAEPVDRVPSLPHGFDRLERGRNFWREKELTQPIVLLPGWDGISFGWPADVFIALGRTLAEEELAVISGPGEELQARPVADALGCPWIENPPVQTLMDALATTSLVAGCDGGALHLAAALNKPVVMLTVNPHPWRTWVRASAGATVYRGQEGNTTRVRFDRIPVSDIAAAALQMKEIGVRR